MLADRVGSGVASSKELVVAQLFLLGLNRRRKPPHQTMERQFALMRFLMWATAKFPDAPRKQIIGLVADSFDVSPRHVYDVERKFTSMLA
jgi:hypothetical protein